MSERKCRRCDKYIPFSMRIDGKRRNLKGRKFCIECSPYKQHNTSPFGPEGMEESKRKKHYKYSEYTQEEKTRNKLSLYKRGLERKEFFINKSGGKCSKCGYNKSKKALQFHHLRPEEKEFGLSLNELWSKPIDLLEKEWEKCQLLCANCHIEVEEEMARTGFDCVSAVNKKYGTNF